MHSLNRGIRLKLVDVRLNLRYNMPLRTAGALGFIQKGENWRHVGSIRARCA